MLIPIGDNIERRSFPIVPTFLIVANILVFVVQYRIMSDAIEAGHTGEEPPAAMIDFVETWGLVPTDMMEGHIVGVVTHMFLHGDFLHLLGNMFFLWAFSCSLEVSLGRWKFLRFYLLFGIVGGLAHAGMNLSSDLPLVGASGAIAGVMGAYTVLYGLGSKIHVFMFFWITPVRFTVPTGIFGLFWFLMQMLLAGLDPDSNGGVAWFAHIGGFLIGAVVMEMCRSETKVSLSQDRVGNVFLYEDKSDRALEEVEVEDQNSLQLPSVCPYCAHEMATQKRVSDIMARCDNIACGRIIYLNA